MHRENLRETLEFRKRVRAIEDRRLKLMKKVVNKSREDGRDG